ncbi:unnamed protein product [Paramecium sonneborni]|uniref:Uncharacterized protein n=1 Tax=Paramecium sonneborni TaxID=65129 RepID=A0A8S1LJC2_9CILI|nr:unnamed protein product [Paramecium sonneborni]
MNPGQSTKTQELTDEEFMKLKVILQNSRIIDFQQEVVYSDSQRDQSQ